jgi:hypothetical protein
MMVATDPITVSRTSSAGAMRLLFGAATVEVMALNRTALRMVVGFRVWSESRRNQTRFDCPCLSRAEGHA